VDEVDLEPVDLDPVVGHGVETGLLGGQVALKTMAPKYQANKPGRSQAK
jgi:hypothetical protein